MSSRSNSESADDSLASLLGGGACLFDISCSPMEQTNPGAGKTLTILMWVADLAATVDRGNGVERNYGTSSQG